jgi:hypothetical protein
MPTATSTPTNTATPTPGPCTVTQTVTPLLKGQGSFVQVTAAGSGTISATWQIGATKNTISLYIYAGAPFAGQTNPISASPPANSLTSNSGNTTTLTATTGSQPAGTYTVYVYNRGNALPGSSTVQISYVKATCP